MGAWTALWARRSGREVTLIDAYGAGHPRATSGDETRIIRASHGADVFYTRWSRRALEPVEGRRRGVGRAAVPRGRHASGSPADSDGFEAASESTLRAEGIPVDRLTPAEVAERWPHMAVDDIAFALHEPEAGPLLARRGVAMVAEAFAAEGGRFELAIARPGRRDGRRLRWSSAPTERPSRRRSSSSPAGRGCRGSSRRSSATSSG